MKFLIKLFLEDQGDYILGPGRLELLRATEALGSLHKAAQSLGMSYRWAWGRLQKSEKALGIKLLTPEGSTGRGSPKLLTTEGRDLLRWYGEIEVQLMANLADFWHNRPDFLKNAAERNSRSKV